MSWLEVSQSRVADRSWLVSGPDVARRPYKAQVRPNHVSRSQCVRNQMSKSIVLTMAASYWKDLKPNLESSGEVPHTLWHGS